MLAVHHWEVWRAKEAGVTEYFWLCLKQLVHFFHALHLSFVHHNSSWSASSRTKIHPLWCDVSVIITLWLILSKNATHFIYVTSIKALVFFRIITSYLKSCFLPGYAAGASSILLIRPHHIHTKPPKGVAVVILVNLQRVNLEKTAMDVAACFEKTRL